MDPQIDIEGHRWQKSGDGSWALINESISEGLHSLDGAQAEAKYVYISPSKLELALSEQNFHILETGLGSGMNLQVSLEAAGQCQGTLSYVSMESNRDLVEMVAETLVNRFGATRPTWKNLSPQAELVELFVKQHHIRILLGDARETLPKFQIYAPDWRFDYLFHDAFSPANCPQLWIWQFFSALAHSAKDDARGSTYCASVAARQALIKGGWTPSEGAGFARKRSMTHFTLSKIGDHNPLLERLKRSNTQALCDSLLQ